MINLTDLNTALAALADLIDGKRREVRSHASGWAIFVDTDYGCIIDSETFGTLEEVRAFIVGFEGGIERGREGRDGAR